MDPHSQPLQSPEVGSSRFAMTSTVSSTTTKEADPLFCRRPPRRPPSYPFEHLHFDIVHESGLEFDGTTAILHYFCPYAKYFGCSVKVWEGSSDAAYADDLDTRRSFEGYLFKLFGGPIDWKATCQFTVTTSTTEAELLAACHAGKEIFAWRRIFAQFGFDFGEDLDLGIVPDQQWDNWALFGIASLYGVHRQYRLSVGERAQAKVCRSSPLRSRKDY
ncbi:hypothetical protein VTN31DRAFT_2390 [Thermomyces dupontii]|uniref:uncharacterized protein n=1 Tax=Talaromyces thermophilus TaxID=28565 RepID=UPI00374490F2